MVFNMTAMVLAVSFLVLSVIAAATEKMSFRKASLRGFFRRLRITLRELSPLVAVLIGAVYLMISVKLKDADIWATVNILAVFVIGYLILNSHRIFGFARPAKRKKKSAKLLDTLTVGEVNELAEVPELPELPELPVTAEESA